VKKEKGVTRKEKRGVDVSRLDRRGGIGSREGTRNYSVNAPSRRVGSREKEGREGQTLLLKMKFERKKEGKPREKKIELQKEEPLKVKRIGENWLREKGGKPTSL